MSTNQVAEQVWTTPDGAPARFIWNQRRFVAWAKPLPWIARIPWWEVDADRGPNPADRGVEQAMWQVEAKALDNGEILIFDLGLIDPPQWRIRAVFS
ncbi:hypothetical protein [Rarobacter faecitabidus]|uniref:Uncharacterized protein n=1 Tax=Rarobacter faecitabidus TaxID=13243 RepID=A0A542ZWR1_RARFA|nr:hypothetical protein [Rarobacter faecitabidus]TQL64787.1 hypothetical protein FB461_1308 [Rarobacter faecitabidus]